MNLSLKNFRTEYYAAVLNFLWRQWSALGVAGEASPEEGRIVDPEALLIFTCTIGRHDSRLFDEMLDWLQTNGWLLNIMRIKRIRHTEEFAGERVLSAIAGLLARGSGAPKWGQLATNDKPAATTEELFFAEDGHALPVLGEAEPHFARFGWKRGALRMRGYSQEFRPAASSNLILQLRALMGISVRCEIVAYLLTHGSAHPSQIARESYFFDRAVQGTLVDMSRSGVIQIRLSGREKNYWLSPDQWLSMLNRGGQTVPKWINWPPLFSALEQIWLRLADVTLTELDPLLQSSELRQLTIKIRPSLERAGFDRVLSDDRQYQGESYLPVFFADMKNLISAFSAHSDAARG